MSADRNDGWTVTAKINVPVSKKSVGAQVLGWVQASTIVLLIIGFFAQYAHHVAIPFFLLAVFVFTPGHMIVRRNAGRRIAATVNEALANALHSNLRITPEQCRRLYDKSEARLADGNVCITVGLTELKPDDPERKAIGTDSKLTITAMHGDLGFGAFDAMVHAVLTEQ